MRITVTVKDGASRGNVTRRNLDEEPRAVHAGLVQQLAGDRFQARQVDHHREAGATPQLRHDDGEQGDARVVEPVCSQAAQPDGPKGAVEDPHLGLVDGGEQVPDDERRNDVRSVNTSLTAGMSLIRSWLLPSLATPSAPPMAGRTKV